MKTIAFGSAEAPPPPSKIVAVGRNYRDHAAELGNVVPDQEPLLFLKAPSTLVIDGGEIVLPPESSRVDYEGELALVIGRRIKSWPEGRWLDALAGVCCANDVTARDLQKKDGQFARAKSFDTFCPIGPAIVPDLDASDLAIETRVNGVVKQSSRTSQMVFSPAFLVAYVSRMMTLLPGDLILTGTPAGVGPLAPGDVVEVEIEKVGVLKNRVAAADARRG
ncbi:MAG TPA: fumarylacetoacetate hydrolase family protein [Thermoanaerobaculia bacterium]|nr:fumarylacetoacetate hydrolase family protein [Thermoanaerobaculia bacterium]